VCAIVRCRLRGLIVCVCHCDVCHFEVPVAWADCLCASAIVRSRSRGLIVCVCVRIPVRAVQGRVWSTCSGVCRTLTIQVGPWGGPSRVWPLPTRVNPTDVRLCVFRVCLCGVQRPLGPFAFGSRSTSPSTYYWLCFPANLFVPSTYLDPLPSFGCVGRSLTPRQRMMLQAVIPEAEFAVGATNRRFCAPQCAPRTATVVNYIALLSWLVCLPMRSSHHSWTLWL
jgi:hypothetical protein